MKSQTLLRVSLLGVAALFAASPEAFAQRNLGQKKGPTSKMYIAETKGSTDIRNAEKVYTARQATAFDAPGTVIETKDASSNAFVYSNGTGMFVDQNTRVEVDRFVQEPFTPDRATNTYALMEPSISQSEIYLARGAIGICTSQLVSGSSMRYSTPHGSVNIRGGKVAIMANADETVIDLLEGDVTVRGGDRDIGGQILRAGERATIRPAPPGLPSVVTISPIPPEALPLSEERTTIACNAKKTVTFEVIEQRAAEGLDGQNDGSQELVPKPTVPRSPPTNIVISPDRLP